MSALRVVTANNWDCELEGGSLQSSAIRISIWLSRPRAWQDLGSNANVIYGVVLWPELAHDVQLLVRTPDRCERAAKAPDGNMHVLCATSASFGQQVTGTPWAPAPPPRLTGNKSGARSEIRRVIKATPLDG